MGLNACKSQTPASQLILHPIDLNMLFISISPEATVERKLPVKQIATCKRQSGLSMLVKLLHSKKLVASK